MGDLIRMSHSELHATIELLDRLGVTPRDFLILRKTSSWRQATTARVYKADPSIWAALVLEDAAVRSGFTLGDLRALAGNDDILAKVRDVVRGFSEIKPIPHAIDCDADPFVPDGWKVEEHTKGGIFTWDPTKVEPYLSEKQKSDEYIVGNKLRGELKAQPVLNANVLDYLLSHPELIPEDWKKDERGKTRHIFFWGTIYRHYDDLPPLYDDGLLHVRFLYWGRSYCRWGSICLGDVWVSNDPAAVRVS